VLNCIVDCNFIHDSPELIAPWQQAWYSCIHVPPSKKKSTQLHCRLLFHSWVNRIESTLTTGVAFMHTCNPPQKEYSIVFSIAAHSCVKVLKPGVEDILTTDMSYIYLFSRFLEFIQPDLARLSLTGVCVCGSVCVCVCACACDMCLCVRVCVC